MKEIIKLGFDDNGNLEPHEKNVIDVETFYSFLVDKFPDSFTRKDIFLGYAKYIEDLFLTLGMDSFIQYVSGSFITNKQDPADIDVLNIINVNCLYSAGKEKRKEIFQKLFTRHEIGDKVFTGKSKEIYKVDAYLIPLFAKEDERYKSETLKRIILWQRLSLTRKNQPSGYLKIYFNQKTRKKLVELAKNIK